MNSAFGIFTCMPGPRGARVGADGGERRGDRGGRKRCKEREEGRKEKERKEGEGRGGGEMREDTMCNMFHVIMSLNSK